MRAKFSARYALSIVIDAGPERVYLHANGDIVVRYGRCYEH